MAMTMHVDIVSAEEEIFSGTATFLVAPAQMGEVGIAPRHTPLLSPLKSGEVKVTLQDGEEQFIFVSGGMLEIQPHVVTILADTAVRAKDLDEAAAIEAKERAEDALKDKASEIDYAKAQAELAEAVAQLQTIKKMKKRMGAGS
jgi:F-type H+-transporting ATPase subunit epsilon